MDGEEQRQRGERHLPGVPHLAQRGDADGDQRDPDREVGLHGEAHDGRLSGPTDRRCEEPICPPLPRDATSRHGARDRAGVPGQTREIPAAGKHHRTRESHHDPHLPSAHDDAGRRPRVPLHAADPLPGPVTGHHEPGRDADHGRLGRRPPRTAPPRPCAATSSASRPPRAPWSPRLPQRLRARASPTPPAETSTAKMVYVQIRSAFRATVGAADQPLAHGTSSSTSPARCRRTSPTRASPRTTAFAKVGRYDRPPPTGARARTTARTTRTRSARPAPSCAPSLHTIIRTQTKLSYDAVWDRAEGHRPGPGQQQQRHRALHRPLDRQDLATAATSTTGTASTSWAKSPRRLRYERPARAPTCTTSARRT